MIRILPECNYTWGPNSSGFRKASTGSWNEVEQHLPMKYVLFRFSKDSSSHFAQVPINSSPGMILEMAVNEMQICCFLPIKVARIFTQMMRLHCLHYFEKTRQIERHHHENRRNSQKIFGLQHCQANWTSRWRLHISRRKLWSWWRQKSVCEAKFW